METITEEAHVGLREVALHMAVTLPAVEWNHAVTALKEDDASWRLDAARSYLAREDFSGMNLAGADFSVCNLRDANFRGADLRNVNFNEADIEGADFSCADMTDSNYQSAYGWQTVTHVNTTGYKPPLPDVTESVARHHLRDAIRDIGSPINEGLAALRDNGMRVEWMGDRLKFWIAHEIEGMRNDCETGDCHCETMHACHGECDCCACYTGDCECEPDHDYESGYETGEKFLATVIGELKYVWGSQGFYGMIELSQDTLHPHVDTNGRACWGNAYFDTSSLRASDYLLTVLGWVGQHNPASEYRPINDLPQIY